MTLVSFCWMNIQMIKPNVKREDGSKNEGTSEVKLPEKEKMQRCQLKNGQAK